jgi:hypothetical protein
MKKIGINIEDLATFVFKTNEEKNVILEVNSLRTVKELFYLCFDLFCKGLVILFGVNNKLVLNKLRENQIEEVRNKLLDVHINTNVVQYSKDTAILVDLLDQNMSVEKVLQNSINKISDMGDDMCLDEYEFEMLIGELFMTISFNISH